MTRDSKHAAMSLLAAVHQTQHVCISQVEMIAGTATAVAVSSFRRDRELAEQRRARASGDLLDPAARFATVVQVGFMNSVFSVWGFGINNIFQNFTYH